MSKYTEGLNEKALRPNGLPKSLIRYDGKNISSHYWQCVILTLQFTFNHLISFISSSEGDGFGFHDRGGPNC